jgi:hypothetical protein
MILPHYERGKKKENIIDKTLSLRCNYQYHEIKRIQPLIYSNEYRFDVIGK